MTRRSAAPRSVGSLARVLCSRSLRGCRQDMHDQPQATSRCARATSSPTSRSARPLVEGTVARGHAARGRRAFYTGKDGGGFVDALPVPVTRELLRARAAALQHLLLALPRPHRRRQRHDRPARLQAAAARSTSTGCAQTPVGYFFDVITNGFGAMPTTRPRSRRRPLGDRRLHPRAAAQPARARLDDVPAGRARPSSTGSRPGRAEEHHAVSRRRGAPCSSGLDGRRLAVGVALRLAPGRGLPARPARSSSARTCSRYLFWPGSRWAASSHLHAPPPHGRRLGPRHPPPPRGRRAHAALRWRCCFVPARCSGLGRALPVGAARGRGGRRARSQHKAPYLNVPFFLRPRRLLLRGLERARLAAEPLVAASRTAAPDAPRGARQLRGLSGVGLVLLGLTITFAVGRLGACRSTRTGSRRSTACCSWWARRSRRLAFVIVLIALPRGRASRCPHVAAAGHFHDLGKLLLAFMMLWAYVNFSQFLIIWSGNLREEIPFYLHRAPRGLADVAMLLLVFHFALPFLLLLSRDAQAQRRARLGAVAALHARDARASTSTGSWRPTSSATARRRPCAPLARLAALRRARRRSGSALFARELLARRRSCRWATRARGAARVEAAGAHEPDAPPSGLRHRADRRATRTADPQGRPRDPASWRRSLAAARGLVLLYSAVSRRRGRASRQPPPRRRRSRPSMTPSRRRAARSSRPPSRWTSRRSARRRSALLTSYGWVDEGQGHRAHPDRATRCGSWPSAACRRSAPAAAARRPAASRGDGRGGAASDARPRRSRSWRAGPARRARAAQMGAAPPPQPATPASLPRGRLRPAPGRQRSRSTSPFRDEAGRAVRLGDYFGKRARGPDPRLLRVPDAVHAEPERPRERARACSRSTPGRSSRSSP